MAKQTPSHLRIFDPSNLEPLKAPPSEVRQQPIESLPAFSPRHRPASSESNRLAVAERELETGHKKVECILSQDPKESFIIAQLPKGGFEITLPRGASSVSEGAGTETGRTAGGKRASAKNQVRAVFNGKGELQEAHIGPVKAPSIDPVLELVDLAVNRRLEQYVNAAVHGDPVPTRVIKR